MRNAACQAEIFSLLIKELLDAVVHTPIEISGTLEPQSILASINFEACIATNFNILSRVSRCHYCLPCCVVVSPSSALPNYATQSGACQMEFQYFFSKHTVLTTSTIHKVSTMNTVVSIIKVLQVVIQASPRLHYTTVARLIISRVRARLSLQMEISKITLARHDSVFPHESRGRISRRRGRYGGSCSPTLRTR